MPPHKRKPVDKLEEGISYFTDNNSATKVRGNLPLNLALTNIEEIAQENGLSAQVIDTLVDVIRSGRFTYTVTIKLIQSLIPQDKVMESSVLKLLSWMCTNQPASNIQAKLIRWIILIYEMLESKDKLHSMYGIIFYFLEDETMCPHVCHLLYLMTRKEDVKMFRVRAILQLQNRMGQQPYLLGLLSVYKLYYPWLVTMTIARNRKGFFKQLDRAWAAKIRKVQEQHQGTGQQDGVGIDSSLIAMSAKRRKEDMIPAVTAPKLDYDRDSGEQAKVPFAQIKSFSQMVDSLDRLEIPEQIAAVFGNRNLQHVVSCYPAATTAARIDNWLNHMLYEEFFNCTEVTNRGEHLLKLLIQFSSFIQEGIPVCNNFLFYYLSCWNGTDYRPYILKLLTKMRLLPFEDLYDLVLEPIRILFFCSTVYFKCQVIVCLTELLRNFAMVELPRYKHSARIQLDETASENTYDRFSIFTEEVVRFDGVETIIKLVHFVDTLSTVGLQTELHSPLLGHLILTFYQLVSEVHEDYNLPVVIIPPRGVIYQFLFSNCILLVNQLCDMIYRYRSAFQSLRLVDAGEDTHHKDLSIQQIKTLNSFILDICDTLWRYRSFISGESNTIFKLFNEEEIARIKAANGKESFSLHLHPAFLGLALKFIELTQPAGSKKHPSALQTARDEFMDLLSREHFEGIPKFLRVFIKRKS